MGLLLLLLLVVAVGIGIIAAGIVILSPLSQRRASGVRPHELAKSNPGGYAPPSNLKESEQVGVCWLNDIFISF